jgi:hypothetical protein
LFTVELRHLVMEQGRRDLGIGHLPSKLDLSTGARTRHAVLRARRGVEKYLWAKKFIKKLRPSPPSQVLPRTSVKKTLVVGHRP